MLDHLNLALKKLGPLVSRSTCRPAPRPRWAAWPATTPAAAAASPTATWCTTCWARRPGRPTASCTRFGRFEDSARHGARHRRPRAGPGAAQLAPEIDEHWPKVLRRVGGYNLDIFRNQNERPYTARRRRQPGAPAGGQRRHAGPDALAHAAAGRAAQGQGAGRGELPDLLQGHGCGPAHRQAGCATAR